MDLLYQTEATSELINRDGTHVSLALKMKLDSKKLLKHVLIGTSVKRWTKAGCRKDRRTREDITISIVSMEMIFDNRTWAIVRSGWFRYGDYHLACVIIIEVVAISTITQ